MATVWNLFSQGEIIWLDFGSNIGSELCGRHFAIVVEKENSVHKDTLVVIPISSLKLNGKIRPFDVNLKNLIPSGKISLAKTSQITVISKKRILSRLYNGHCLRLSDEQLTNVQRAMKLMLLSDEAA